MPPFALEGDTLGKKHQHYNKLVKDALADKHYQLSKINLDDSDINNLMKIDIANKTRNVDYIIDVMKSDDMLYVSRAIKRSTWLITEQQYANIINPEYLHTQLFPSMNTKSANKLMLHIRLNLKDENRVEAFYDYLKETKEAYKWLQNCSIPFIKNVIQNGKLLPPSLFKRLCRKSITFLAYYTRVEGSQYVTLRKILFLLKTHSADFLKILEDERNTYIPTLGKKYTDILMKTSPQRILDKFETYVDSIDLSVVAKHLNKEEIKGFLYKHVKNPKTKAYFADYDNLKHFVQNMPKDERFEFITTTFIVKTNVLPEIAMRGSEACGISCSIDFYHWYQYIPFNVAFTDIKKLVRAENSPSERSAMLSILITCAKKNSQHIKTLLKFYYEKHINEPFKFKLQFVNKVLTQIAIHELDSETWKILNQLFHSMEVFTELENNVQVCLKYIIVYKVLHNETIPEIVETKIRFDTFKKHMCKLNLEQQEKLFTYLLNSISTKIQKLNIANKSDFNEAIGQLKNALILLRDWNKDLIDFPFIHNKIRELIKIKKDNRWHKKMNDLYNIKKSWRKQMLEESLTLNLNEEACLNALRHDPELLTRYKNQMDTLRTNDAVSLRRLLAKLRVYWPDSLAQQWIAAYLENLNKFTRHKTAIRGLFMLLPQKEIINMAKKHVPEDFRIIWGEIEAAEISLRKNIAQHLHVARPLTPLDTVLWYAKGDYLQYAVPSLNAILHSLSKVRSHEYLPKLLEAPVSLQKFGLHLAFIKLKSEELKPIFSKIWKATKNTSIRAVLFMRTYDLLCKAKNVAVEKELWELLSIFIDNLSPDENKEIYKKLSKVEAVPLSIQAKFYMKSYGFLTSLPERTNCKMHVVTLLQYAPVIMESLDENFVVDKILSQVETKFCTFKSNVIHVLASFVLLCKTEEDQLKRYRRVLVPAMEHAFQFWDNVFENQYYIKDNFNKLLRDLIWNFRKFVSLNNIPIPAKLFTLIKIKMEEEMPLHKNYVLYTSWKLHTEYVKLINEHKSIFSALEFASKQDYGNRWMSDEIENVWKEIHFKISPALGRIIVECLKEDTKQYFPTICWLFTDALHKMFEDLYYPHCMFMLETLKYMLDDEDFTPSYLVVCNEILKYSDDEEKTKQSPLRLKIMSHPSKEVQMHYHRVFGDTPEDTFE